MGDDDTYGDGGRMRRQPGGNWSAEEPAIHAVLSRAECERVELLPTGSNYVFAMYLRDDEGGAGAAIYKPRRGESPLWDFPEGTLYQRERAAYLLSRALGWNIIPPTVIRDGPHGVGMVQLYIEHRPKASYFTMRGQRHDELRRMAVFDAIANNADRKGGHCLEAVDGQVWGIDHGLTFHTQGKLRTVIWDYAGEPVDGPLLGDLERLLVLIEQGSAELAELRTLLHAHELAAIAERINCVLSERTFPQPPPWRSVPWPPL